MIGWKAPAAFAVLGIAVAGGYFAWKSHAPLQVRLCEGFIKEGLASPASYRRVSVLEDKEPITIPGLQKLRPETFSDKHLDGPRELLTVIIEYDAENHYGASLRTAGMCAFEMRNGKEDKVGWETGARMATSTANLRGLADGGVLPNVKPGEFGKAGKYPCCL